ncbi:hypothetical protein CVV68_09715 [Arthrobacter livingstonensis]|uniref:DUF1990 domain-containing protein n=1 Tax=Arthrobacter livingstonensis TaxID=670078 RepID=A0A2V5LAZ7_9MICC|nr:hypothetical protein CVV68_09715 [Arthrobacter livingstonensis]
MTNPDLGQWLPSDGRYRRSEVSAVVGRGDTVWERATGDVLRWKVKTSSGFTVNSTAPVGQRVVVTARLFGLAVVEPVEVTAVVKDADRVGFAYRPCRVTPFAVRRHLSSSVEATRWSFQYVRSRARHHSNPGACFTRFFALRSSSYAGDTFAHCDKRLRGATAAGRDRPRRCARLVT